MADAQLWISVGILVVLFGVQRFGTEKVGFSFAPITMVWFLFITGIGLFNLFVYGFGVLHAFNPWCMVEYFQRNGKRGFISLGGTFLCITGRSSSRTTLNTAEISKFLRFQVSRPCLPIWVTSTCGLSRHT